MKKKNCFQREVLCLQIWITQSCFMFCSLHAGINFDKKWKFKMSVEITKKLEIYKTFIEII